MSVHFSCRRMVSSREGNADKILSTLLVELNSSRASVKQSSTLALGRIDYSGSETLMGKVLQPLLRLLDPAHKVC